MTSANTATTDAARDHARAQAAAVTDSMPALPSGIDPSQLKWAETVPGGRYTSKVLARGTRLRLRDVDGSACAHLLLYRADAPWERLNVADTVKVPWQAYLAAGHPLLSDQGRLLATIVSDTSGHHDALCGTTTAATSTAKYGDGSVHGPSPAGRDLLILAAAKNGLSPRDVAPSLSLFHGVRVDSDGGLRSTGSAGADTTVELTLHLPVVVLIANTAHPLDPSPTFDTTSLEILAWHQPADTEAYTDVDAETEPEYQRALHNTEDVWAAAHGNEQ